jgi:hypothetical protein
MPTIIDSLLIRLGFESHPEELEGFAKSAEKAKHMALGMGAAVAGAFAGIEELVKGTAEKMGGIQNFSEQMGISARSVANLGLVARENDSSLGAMEDGLRSMTVMAGQAAQGVGRGALMFKAYGLHAKDANGHVKTTEELLGDVAAKLHAMPSLAQQQALGSRLGFDPATVKLLSEGRGHFEALLESAGKRNPFSDRQYEDAEKAEKMFRKAGDSIVRLKDRIAVGLMPQMNILLEKFIKWTSNEQNINKIAFAIQKVVDISKWLIQNFGKLSAVLAIVYSYKAGAYFTELAVGIAKAVTMQGKLSAALGIFKNILTGGILGLLVLLAEDLWTFSRGGESVTGWMLNRFPYAVEVMEGALVALGAAFLALTFSSGPLGLFALGIGGIIIAAKSLHDAWEPVTQWFGEVWDAITGKVAKFVNLINGPMLWLMKKAGIDTSGLTMDEDPAKTRATDENARLRFLQAQQRREGMALRSSPQYQTAATRSAGMLPGMGMLSPLLGAAAAGRVPATANVNQTTIGNINMHIDGSKLGADDSEKLFRDFAKQLQDRGITSGQDANRVAARNGQGGHV